MGYITFESTTFELKLDNNHNLKWIIHYYGDEDQSKKENKWLPIINSYFENANIILKKSSDFFKD